MSSVSKTPPIPPPPPVDERMVDEQIHRTRRALKTVDATAGVISLLIGILVFLLMASILEHWVIPGGWSPGVRFALFSLFLLGLAWYSWRIFWPLMSQKINPVYAAQAIEQASPSLKNSLLNFLLLRGHRHQLQHQVYQAIQQQAAHGLKKAPIDAAIDRSSILRLGYVLLAIVALGTIYQVFSPKNPLTSVARILAPWSDISVPSRVSITNVTPGDTSLARGEPLQISAEILGLEEDETAHLFYSTLDGQQVDQQVPLKVLENGLRFEGRIPGRMTPGKASGVQQNLVYWIEAGDARSPEYQVSVFARPTLVVSKVRYKYPAYTGYPDREELHTGDISAIEGTRVTVYAQANKAIRQAHVDFEADGKRDLLMKVDSQDASVTFPLELKDDRRTPRYQSYVLRYITEEGRQNLLPPKFQIDVLPDYSPEIDLLLPEEAQKNVRLDEEVEFELEARDPDFAVSSVTLVGKVEDRQVVEESLLSENHQGRFVGKLRKTPEQLGLQVGDVLEYWGTAIDNRRPQANVTHSVHRKLTVIAPNENQEQAPEQGGGEGEGEGEGQEQNQGGEGGQDGQQNADNQEQGGESGEEGGEGEGGAGQQGESGDQEQQDQQQGQGAGQSNEGNEANNEGEQSGNQGGSSQGSEDDSQESGQQNEDPNQGNQSGNENGEQGEQQEKVSADGDDDGTAFERMAEHFNEKDQSDQQGEAGQDKQGEAAQAESDPSEGAQGENNQNAQSDPNNDQQGNSEAGDNSLESNQQSEEQESQQQGREENAQGDANGEEQLPEENEGKQEQTDASPEGEMSNEQGDAGAGENPGENQGAPDANDKKPRDKQGDQQEGERLDDQEAPAQGEGQTESDSEGDQGGDRSGGGQEGAGQQADADGRGGAGQHQDAEQGGGPSDQQGENQTGTEAGDQQNSEEQTGQSSENQSGEGSKQSENPQGQEGEPGGQEGQGEQPNQNGQPDQANPSGGENGEANQDPQQGNSEQGNISQPPQGGGEGGSSAPLPTEGELSEADKANLEYAKKQTDLVLDRLEDQLSKKQVDEDLLEKLGWNEEELRRFVERWKNLKSQVDNPNASKETQQELDEALRSLGLTPRKRYRYRSQTAKDRLKDLQESYRGKVPLEYQESLRAYNKGIATAQEEE